MFSRDDIDSLVGGKSIVHSPTQSTLSNMVVREGVCKSDLVLPNGCVVEIFHGLIFEDALVGAGIVISRIDFEEPPLWYRFSSDLLDYLSSGWTVYLDIDEQLEPYKIRSRKGEWSVSLPIKELKLHNYSYAVSDFISRCKEVDCE